MRFACALLAATASSLALLAAPAFAAPPANDNFADAQTLTGSSTTASVR